MSDRRRWWRWATAIGACAGLAACAAPGATTTGATATSPVVAVGTTAAGSTAPALPDCTGGTLDTVSDGVLTFGTSSPAVEPWFDGDPASGQGLESAVAAEVAQVLGYGSDRVSWVQIDRRAALAGGASGFDVAIDQFVAPDAAADVDYSTGYFSVTAALVIRGDARAPTLAELGSLRLGAVGDRATEPAEESSVITSLTDYAAAAQSLAALKAGELDGVVLPIPDALAAARLDNSIRVVGQLPSDPQTQPEQLRALLSQGSALTGCVSAAIDRLRVEGTLDALAAQWVTPLVPVLR